MEQAYNPKDDINVLALIQAKEDNKVVSIRTYPDMTTFTSRDIYGYVLDFTKNGVILLCFQYTNTDDALIHFKSTVKFEDIEFVSVDKLIEGDLFSKIKNYVEFISKNGFIDSRQDLNLEVFSSKYSEYIVSENNLTTFTESLNEDNTDIDTESDLDLYRSLEKVKEYVNTPDIKKECIKHFDINNGREFCGCSELIEPEIMNENMLFFEDSNYGLCKSCWDNTIIGLNQAGMLDD